MNRLLPFSSPGPTTLETGQPARRIAWHYTTRRKLMGIIAQGKLLPTYVGAKPPELPVLWFSLNQVWEPTAQKDWRNHEGMIQRLGKKGAPQQTGSLVRLGYPAKECIAWPLLAEKAKIPPKIRVALEHAGRQEGANPSEWCGTLWAIPIADLIVEVFDGQKWVAFKPRSLRLRRDKKSG